jgi:hypothetical protein
MLGKFNPSTANAGHAMIKQVAYLLGTAVFVAGYFLLSEFLRPFLIERGSQFSWWSVLLFYLVGGSVIGSWQTIKARPIYFSVALALLLTSVFAYDPTLKVLLTRYGLAWVWVILLLAFFVWVIFGVRLRMSGEREPGTNSQLKD